MCPVRSFILCLYPPLLYGMFQALIPEDGTDAGSFLFRDGGEADVVE
jgi:hypothetical protein